MDYNILITSILAAALPVLTQVIKAFAPKVPKPLLPILPPVLGAGLVLLNNYLPGLQAVNPTFGAVAGAIGVLGYDFLKALPVPAPPVPPAPPAPQA